MRPLIGVLAVVVSACASSTMIADPAEFRDLATHKVVRSVSSAPGDAISNMDRGVTRCWESEDIRVKASKVGAGYMLTVGTYSTGGGSLLFLADVVPFTNGSRVTVSHQYPGHKKFAENIAAWADSTAEKCVSLLPGR